MTTPFQQSPYLRDQRQFPNDDLKELANQVDHAYIDIATKLNSRTIGVFANNFQIVTGESWYLQGSSQKQQTLRQVYQVAGYGAVNHGIDFATVSTFTVIRGIGFDGTNYYPISYAHPTAGFGLAIYVSPTQINFISGPGSPVIVRGIIILEWLSQF
jgi:hypothetical protein